MPNLIFTIPNTLPLNMAALVYEWSQVVNSVCSFNQKAVQNKHTVTNLLQLNKRQNSKLLQEVKEARSNKSDKFYIDTLVWRDGYMLSH